MDIGTAAVNPEQASGSANGVFPRLTQHASGYSRPQLSRRFDIPETRMETCKAQGEAGIPACRRSSVPQGGAGRNACPTLGNRPTITTTITDDGEDGDGEDAWANGDGGLPAEPEASIIEAVCQLGCLPSGQSEIIPIEPEPGHAGVGN